MSNEVIRYSEAFKIRVIEEIESGRFRSPNEARLFYGLGSTTLKNWLLKYGRNHLVKKVVRVETPDERCQVKSLKKRVRELERALADSRVAELMERTFLEIACEDMGRDIHEFKKNANLKRFTAES